MRSVARSLLADEHLVEDVVQQASLKALEQPPRSPGALRTWLATVVRNLAHKTAGREAERPGRERHAAQAEPGDAGRQFELEHRVAAALRALPEPYQTAIHLRYYREMGPREIALELGVPHDTVKTRLRRGLELLRNDLDTQHGGERRAWCLALAALHDVPWRAGLAPSAAGTVAASAILEGIVSMKVFASLAVLTVVVVAVVFVSRPATSPSEPGGVAAAEAAPAELVTPEVEAVELVESETTAAERRAVPAAPVAAPEPAAAPEARAHLVVNDARGQPVEGVRVSFADGESTPALTDAEGAASFDLAALSLENARNTERDLVLSHEDYLTLRASVALGTGSEVDLGTFVVVQGGRIYGTVQDPSSVGVAHALVFAADPAQRFWDDVAGLVNNGNQRFVARADEHGDFVIRGVPAGLVRVWGGAEGLVDGVSTAVTVVAGEDLRDVLVRLAPAPAGSEIAGRVVLPEGQESDSLSVWYSYVSSEGRRTRTAEVGPDGRFRIQLETSVPHDLWAEEPPNRWDDKQHVFTGDRLITGYRGTIARDVPAGTANLVLGFEETLRVPILVTDERGRDIDRFTLVTLEYSGNDLSHQRPWSREVSAPAFLDVPTTDFYVSVSAEGYDSARFGPFDDTTVPLELRVELVSLPAVEGIVRAKGGPVAGASVELYRPSGTTHKVVSNGFRMRMHQVPVAEGVTDKEGRFAVTLRESGSFFVRASAPGAGTDELEDVSIDHTEGAEGIELELSAGGSIEGRLLVPVGESAAGWIVGVSRGDPYPQTVALQPDGRYRFDGLLPGEWLVERVTNHVQTTTISSSRTPVIWSGNCVVKKGETTTFDLDYRDDDRVVLKGRIQVPERSEFRWEAKLSESDGWSFDGDRVDGAIVAEDGTFEMVAPKTGEYLLTLTGGEIENGGILLARRLDLQSDTHEWSETIHLGTVEGTITLNPMPPMVIWIVEDGTSLTATRILAEGDGFFSTEVPAGHGKARYATPELMEALPIEWPVLGSAEVAAGGEATFETVD
jgi:RNA polymerase sigma-70 factor (ECF subfamily)